MDRRNFLKTVGSLALFTIVPRHVLGRGYVAPSDQLTKGIIGVGGMGRGHAGYDGTRLVAVCDVDKKHLELGKQLVKEKIAAYHDFRDLILDPNVDIVHIATPPHWHGIMSVEAAKAGKDIWCEKPMTRTIGEGKRVMEAVERYGRMFRLNTWFRFQDTFYGLGTPVKPLKKLVQSGLLGWPLKVTISKHTGFDWKFYWVGKDHLDPQPVPPELDYDMWLGSTSWARTTRVLSRWKWTRRSSIPMPWACGEASPIPTRTAARLCCGAETTATPTRRTSPGRKGTCTRTLCAMSPTGNGNWPVIPTRSPR